MPYFHATWRRNLPSILRHGLGGAMPDEHNFPVERGVYLAREAPVAVLMLVEAYELNGDRMGMSPKDALESICVIVIDDARIRADLVSRDPNVERTDVTALYRGVVDVAGMPVLSVETVLAAG